MSLKKIYNLTEAEGSVMNQMRQMRQWDDWERSDGVPQAVPGDTRVGATMSQGQLDRVFGGGKKPKQKAGEGPMSNGVPTPFGNGKTVPQYQPNDPDRTVATPGVSADLEPDERTIPNPRPNPGGTGKPPRGAGPFSRAPNAPGNYDEPLPDLPLESRSIKGLFGLTEAQAKAPIRGPARLVELYNIDEMPRPAGSYGAPAMAVLKWAKERAGREFTARDAFPIWRQAGGQPNQPDENKAYQSFQTTLRQFIDPNGRGTPDRPLVTTMAGVRGSRGQKAIYSWGAVRASKTAAAKPTPGRTPYDDMELGPAGGEMPDDQELAGDMGPGDQGEPEPEAPDEQEPEAGDEQAEDEFDWIPEADPETGVGRAMIALQENDPDKLEQLLTGVMDAETVMAAAQGAIRIYGRGTAMGSHAIKVAKSAAANRGLPDPDGVL